MQILSLENALALILKKDQRYHPDAFVFLREVFNSKTKEHRKNQKTRAMTHLSARQCVEKFRDRALKEFGPMTIHVLHYWGIRSSSDIGAMIFLFIDVGILGKTEGDTLDSFSHLLDFKEAFVLPFEAPTLNSKLLSVR